CVSWRLERHLIVTICGLCFFALAVVWRICVTSSEVWSERDGRWKESNWFTEQEWFAGRCPRTTPVRTDVSWSKPTANFSERCLSRSVSYRKRWHCYCLQETVYHYATEYTSHI